jgi:hypothetical protein
VLVQLLLVLDGLLDALRAGFEVLLVLPGLLVLLAALRVRLRQGAGHIDVDLGPSLGGPPFTRALGVVVALLPLFGHELDGLVVVGVGHAAPFLLLNDAAPRGQRVAPVTSQPSRRSRVVSVTNRSSM